MSFTLTDLVSLALKKGLVDSANFDSATQIMVANEALTEYYRDLKGVDGSFTLNLASTPPLVASTQEYALPPNIDRIEEWRFVGFRNDTTGEFKPLMQCPLSWKRILSGQTGEPTHFYVYEPAGVFTVGLVPTPPASGLTNWTVVFDYRYKPTEVTALTDTVYLPKEAKLALVAKMASVFAKIDGNLAYANVLTGEYEAHSARNSETLMDEFFANDNVAPDIVNSPEVGFPPTDPRYYGFNGY